MIKKNDNANGIVQLSATAVRVHEPHTGSVVNVTRTAGDFGTVSEHTCGIRLSSMVHARESLQLSKHGFVSGSTNNR